MRRFGEYYSRVLSHLLLTKLTTLLLLKEDERRLRFWKLVAAQVMHEMDESRDLMFVATDYDFGVLERAEGNRKETVKTVTSATTGVTSALSSMVFEMLAWGDEVEARRVMEVGESVATETTNAAFDLILGSDVIYCKEIVAALFLTIKTMLRSGTNEDENDADGGVKPCMIMSQSFPYDSPTEREIDRCCALHNLERNVVYNTFDREEGEVVSTEGTAMSSEGGGDKYVPMSGTPEIAKGKIQIFTRRR
jgi:hypothetical protein